MDGVIIYMITTAVMRCVAVYCVTQAAIHFDNPWLLLLYIAIPIFGYPGCTFGSHYHKDSEDA